MPNTDHIEAIDLDCIVDQLRLGVLASVRNQAVNQIGHIIGERGRTDLRFPLHLRVYERVCAQVNNQILDMIRSM